MTAYTLITIFLILLAVALVHVDKAEPNGGPESARKGQEVAPQAGTAVTSSATYSVACADAWQAVRYYRGKTAQHRAQLGASELPPVEQNMNCRRLRERARYWRTTAKANRLAAAKVVAARNQIIGRLNRGLAGTPMQGLGHILEQEGRAAGISPFFMAAAAGTESSFGAAPCHTNRRNVWGLASCGNGWHVPYFNTWQEAIRFYARFLAARWPNATSPYQYYGYAACDQCWGRKTSLHMGRFGNGTSTRYAQ